MSRENICEKEKEKKGREEKRQEERRVDRCERIIGSIALICR